MNPPTDAREQARHIIDTVQAYMDGKQIQSQLRFGSGHSWSDDNQPQWDFIAFDYRVKPEERKPRQIDIWMHPNGGLSNHDPLVMGWTGPFLFREVLPETETE